MDKDTFLARLVRADSGCLEWTGPQKGPGYKQGRGYGHLTVGGKYWTAHRFAWVIANGEIPTGLLVLHHCDNTICCEPSHLFLGTQTDNMRDMHAKGRAACAGAHGLDNSNGRKTHCPAGHPYSEENTYLQPSTGGRICRECQRTHNRERKRRLRAQSPTLRQSSSR